MMDFPCKIGLPIPEEVADDFERDEHEYLVACRCDRGWGSIFYKTLNDEGTSYKEGLCLWHSDIAGYVDLTTNTRHRGNGAMKYTFEYINTFGMTPEQSKTVAEQDRRNQNIFQPNRIYRVKGLPPISRPDKELFNNERHMNGFYVTEILSDNEQNEFLQNLLDMWYNKVTIHSDIFGEMVLDKDLMLYSAEATWRRNPVAISISIENEKDDPSAGLAALENFWKKKAAWDKKLRSFAAKQLLEVANQWQEDAADEEEAFIPLTAEQFTKKMKVESITVERDGGFEVWYDDGDLFFGHAIVVYASLEKGAYDAKMMG